MKTTNSKEKLTKLISTKKVDTAKRNKERIRNREMLRESRAIALKVLNRLDELGWTKKRLADEIGVKPQQITKIVSGQENITLKTQLNLQNALNISILANFKYKEENGLKVEVEELIKEYELQKISNSSEVPFYHKKGKTKHFSRKSYNVSTESQQLSYAY